MAKRNRRLGRGLESLVTDLVRAERPEDADGADRQAGAQTSTGSEVVRRPEAMTLPTSQLLPNPCQPRVDMDNDALVILSRSVARCGVLQPIPVRPSAAMQGKYEIVAGERRWRAARLAGLDEVPVIVRDATDEEMLELALVENIQREDLNTIDRAKAYRELRDRFGLGPDEVGERVGEDRSTVTNYLRLLDLAEPIQALVAGAQLSMGHARCLLGVADPERRERLARSAVDNELSVRALEEIVRREKTGRGVRPADGAATPRELSPHIADLQHRFEDALKTKVTIREARAKGRGRIVIEYFSLDDFDRIAQKLGVGLE